MTTSARWRRLDLPGFDEAHLRKAAGGYLLVGAARFDDGGPVALEYSVEIDGNWATRLASVVGSTPSGPLRIEVKATAGAWMFNDNPVPSVAGCIDFDLGFTPATNLLSIRRMNLSVGEETEVTVAWLPSLREMKPLRQVYKRITDDRYRYSCPDLPFDSTLRVGPGGFVLDYPPLWEAWHP